MERKPLSELLAFFLIYAIRHRGDAYKHSDSGVYHVILRGVNKQQIFECTEDYQRFLNILRTLTVREQDESGYRSKPNCVIYAYCLMGNHVHLLIKESSETLAQIMKRISSSYVYYYNHKYGRIGHLFQERFKSQPVGDWGYFREYKWSSWLEYIGEKKMLSVPLIDYPPIPWFV